MTVQPKTTLKTYFETGDTPTQAEFEHLIDSFAHIDDVPTDAELNAHTSDVNNPHSVTKAQVGLSNVDNTADTAKPVSTLQQAAIDAHANLTTNPHSVTKDQVGLGNVDNTADTAKPVSTLQQAAIDAHANRVDNPHAVTKAQVGLGNVDNTADLSKPVSTAQQAAIDAHANRTDNPHSVTAAQLGLGNTGGEYDDVWTMKAQSFSDGDICATTGYWNRGDGGGNKYIYHATGRSVVNGAGLIDEGFYITGANADDYFEAVDKTVANVRHFGAVGDGINDDTVEIQSAINTGVGTFIPNGTYKITDTLSVTTNNICITGQGWGSKIQQVTAEKNVFTITGDGVTVTGIHGIGEDTTAYVLFTNCNFIFATGANNVTIHQCIAEGFRSNGVLIQNTVGIKIHDNFFFDQSNQTASSPGADINVYGGSRDYAITNNVCLSDVRQNIYANANGTDKVGTIVGNICDTINTATFTPATPVYKYHGIFVSYATSTEPAAVTITGNSIANCGSSGIYVTGESGAINITGNTIDSVGAQDPGSGISGGVLVTGQPYAVTVHNNVVNNFSSTFTANTGGITIATDITKSGERVSVTNNYILDSNTNGIYFSGNGDHGVIAGNYIANPAQQGIRVIANTSADMRVTVKDNVITQNADKTGIYLDSQPSAEVVTISGNYLFNTGSGTTLVQTGINVRNRNCIVVNNYIEGYIDGIYQQVTIPSGTRETGAVYRGNTFVDLTNAHIFRGNDAYCTVPAESNKYYNVTNQFAGGGFFTCGYESTVLGPVIHTRAAAAPTVGQWIVGDIVYNTAPAAAGTIGWVCVTAGGPGTWKTFGTIAS